MTPAAGLGAGDPAHGRVIWQYDEDRAPVAAFFQDNNIVFVFKNEVQVLKYLTF